MPLPYPELPLNKFMRTIVKGVLNLVDIIFEAMKFW